MNDDGMIGGMKKVWGNGRTPRKPTLKCLSTTKPTWVRV